MPPKYRLDEEAQNNVNNQQQEAQEDQQEEATETPDAEALEEQKAAQPNGGARAATPEEQHYANIAMKQVSEWLSQKDNAAILVQLARQTSPAEAIARIGSQLLEVIKYAAAKSGKQLSDGLLYGIGINVAAFFAHALVQGKIIKAGDEERVAIDAINIAKQMMAQRGQ